MTSLSNRVLPVILSSYTHFRSLLAILFTRVQRVEWRLGRPLLLSHLVPHSHSEKTFITAHNLFLQNHGMAIVRARGFHPL